MLSEIVVNMHCSAIDESMHLSVEHKACISAKSANIHLLQQVYQSASAELLKDQGADLSERT